MKLPSLANTRLHWRSMVKLKHGQRTMVAAMLAGKRCPQLPVVVTLTRVGKRRLDDDNLAAAFKFVRDQVAHWVGVDDGSPLYEWRYGQRIGAEYAIEIEIEESP